MGRRQPWHPRCPSGTSRARHTSRSSKTNNAEKFWVEPKSGFISPGMTLPIRVELRPGQARALWDGDVGVGDFASDRFLIQSVSVLPGDETDNLEAVALSSEDEKSNAVNTIFQNADSKSVLNTKRNVSVRIRRKTATVDESKATEAPQTPAAVTATASPAATAAVTATSAPAAPAASAAPAAPAAPGTTMASPEKPNPEPMPSPPAPSSVAGLAVAPPATPAHLASVPAAKSLIGTNQGIQRRSLEEQIMMGGLPPDPNTHSVSSSDSDLKLQALKDKMTMLEAKEAEFLIVIKEKTEQNDVLRANCSKQRSS